jgi:hypothetical protein
MRIMSLRQIKKIKFENFKYCFLTNACSDLNLLSINVIIRDKMIIFVAEDLK